MQDIIAKGVAFNVKIGVFREWLTDELSKLNITVSNIRIPLNSSTGIGRGYAVFSVLDRPTAERVILHLVNKRFNNQRLQMELARQPESRPDPGKVDARYLSTRRRTRSRW